MKTATTLATRHDVDELVRLVNSAYRGTSSQAGWTTEAEVLDGQRIDREMLLARLPEDQSEVVLCLRSENGGPILGCVHLIFQKAECHLGMLTIRPDLQNSGMGRQLLDAAEEMARERGARRMTIVVIHVRDSLIAWYERRGYRATGKTKAFPYGDERFGIPKRDDLHFIEFEKHLS